MNQTQLQDTITKSVNDLTQHFVEHLEDVTGYLKEGNTAQANAKLSQCDSMWPSVSRIARQQIKLQKQQENFTRYQPQTGLPLEVGGTRSRRTG